MFETLSKRLTGALDKLRARGSLTEADVDAALREVRVALLEADVALPVVKSFTTRIKDQLIGAKVYDSISPVQMVIKLVYDELVVLLGGALIISPPSRHGATTPTRVADARGSAYGLPTDHSTILGELNLNCPAPAVILMCGLQGSGKTTSTGKLAKRLSDKQRKKCLVASLDIYRPAAQEQLATVAKTAGVDALPIVAGEQPQAITKRALDAARKGGYDVLLLDTAGRLHVDDALMAELKAVKALANPIETLLVADALTGQDAVNIATSFHEAIGVTGIILTRVDGDGRGGAALSMREVTGQPIKFAGVGEGVGALEPFHPERIASRILDKGDVISLVERAAEAFDETDTQAMAARMQKGQFDFNDMLKQMRSIKKMGGVSSLMGMLPGMGKVKEMMEGKTVDESALKRTEAIILSMTKTERANPKLLNASRKKRIAAGSGTEVQEINRLIKQYQQMETLMKHMKKSGMKGLNPQMLKGLMGG